VYLWETLSLHFSRYWLLKVKQLGSRERICLS